MTKDIGKNSFVKQAAILALASILVRVIGFLYRVPLTNLIGDEGNGIYGTGYYIYTFLLVVSSAGLPAAISKMVSERVSLGRYRDGEKVFKVSLIVAAVLGLAGSLFMFFGAEWLCEITSSQRSYYAIISLSPTILIVAIMAVFRGYFQGMNTTVPTAVSQLVEQIFHAVTSVYLAYILVGYGVEYGAAGGTAGTGIGALVGLIVIFSIYIRNKKKLKSNIKEDTKSKNESSLSIAKGIVMLAVPIITGTAIFSMANLIDMQMVKSRLICNGAFTIEEAEALYGQLTGKYTTLTTLPVSISTAFATAILPNIAAAIALNQRETVKSKINTALRITMLIAIPSAFGIGILGDEILRLLFPAASEGGILLKVGAVSIISLGLSQIATGILQGMGRVYKPARNAFFGMLVKIPINYFLIAIPQINVIGAVISSVACYSVAAGLNVYCLVKYSDTKLDFKGILLKPLLCSVIMGFVCYMAYHIPYSFIQNNTLCTVFSIASGLFVYFISLLLVGGLKKEDISLMPLGSKINKICGRYIKE